MSFTYDVLNQQTFSNGKWSIVPIRMEDRHVIREWRNEQMFHLRQSKFLSKEDQDHYFNTTVKDLFSQEKPNQILFSYLENDEFIGYGGLVHINWIDKNAEVSFLTKTDVKGTAYETSMVNFMGLLDKVTFKELDFHKLFTYAFDVRPEIYETLEKSGFHKETTLKEHCHFDGKFIDVLIHSKFNPQHKLSFNKQIKYSDMLTFRFALPNDSDLYFQWTNDALVRKNSLNTNDIKLEDHKKWFANKIANPDVLMYVFLDSENQPVGQVVIELKNDWIILGQSVAKAHRGKKYSSELLTKSTNDYIEKFPERTIVSVVKSTNIPSLKMSVNSGFNVLDKNNKNENVLVLKGCQQNDESYIKKAKAHYKLI
jgi:RimJ/RimL family protein N-acetyltransferase